ncbi:unnamed protein product [Ostreobium quekettii]|uniref:Uncharacterized protein n=1 Tax=Ostreobium quekettii TaxID=121088 RepID=A0A8S1JG64_9CHLO|nr:unnamed protein product [Ostreobium quekettii]
MMASFVPDVATNWEPLMMAHDGHRVAWWVCHVIGLHWVSTTCVMCTACGGPTTYLVSYWTPLSWKEGNKENRPESSLQAVRQNLKVIRKLTAENEERANSGGNCWLKMSSCALLQFGRKMASSYRPFLRS